MAFADTSVAEVLVPGSGIGGSGYLLSPHLILTAHHVVSELPKVEGSPDLLRANPMGAWATSGPSCKVRLLQGQIGAPYHEARPVWVDENDDVALLLVADTSWQPPPQPPTTWADINRIDPVPYIATGFPIESTQVEDGEQVRESREVFGVIKPVSQTKHRLLELNVDHEVELVAGSSAWGGMSGAAVFSSGLLVGVVRSDPHPDHPAGKELLAVPLSTFGADPVFRAWLAADDGPEGWRKAARPAVPSGTLQDTKLSLELPTAREGDLVGRVELIAACVDQLRKSRDVVLQSGLPGVGKTALANAIVHDPDINSHFDGGRLWLSVGKPDADLSRHWIHRMGTWARRLGVRDDEVGQAEQQNDRSGMAALVNAALGDRNCLLVFDDVWDVEDARLFLLIGSSSSRLITTRLMSVADLLPAGRTPVPELSYEDSIALVQELVPDVRSLDSSKLEQAVSGLGGLPLTILLVAAGLRRQVERTGYDGGNEYLDTLTARERLKLDTDRLPASQLSDMAAQHRTLKNIIELTTDALKRPERATLRDLAAFPPKANTFGRSVAKAVAEKERHLDTLADFGLIELVDRASPRYAMHQAIADFARQGKKGDADAFRRMIDFFLDFIESTSKTKSTWDWIAALQPEAENIRAALAWAIAAKDTSRGLALMAALWDFWYRTSQFARARDLAREVLALPRTEPTSTSEQIQRAQLLNDAGNYAYNMADLNEAEPLHRESLSLRQSAGATHLVPGNLNNIGLVLRERGAYDEAIHHFDDALAGNRASDYDKAVDWAGMNLNNLGITHHRRGDYDLAALCQRQSIDEFRGAVDNWGMAMARVDLAMSLIEGGSVDRGRQHLAEILEYANDTRDVKMTSSVLRGFAAIALREDDPPRARDCSMASVVMSAEVTDRLGQGHALETLVVAGHLSGNADLAARAVGALDGYRERSGFASSDRVSRQVESAIKAARDGDSLGFDDIADEARADVAGDLVNIVDAVGAGNVDREGIVDRLRGVPA